MSKQETQQMTLEWAKEVKTKHPKSHAISIIFSGSGDSGDITDVYTDGEDGAPLNPPDFLYDLIENHVTCDWVNNEGGGGNIQITLNDFTMQVNSYYREVVDNDCDMLSLSLSTT